GLETVILDVQRLYASLTLGAARTAEFGVEEVRPVAEHPALKAELRAPEIRAAGKIGTDRQQPRGCVLVVIGRVELREKAQRERKARVRRGNRRPSTGQTP